MFAFCLGCLIAFHLLYFLLFCLQDERALFKELKKRAKQVMAERNKKRVEIYKNKLKDQLPSQIRVWNDREQRLVKVVSGTAGFSLVALLVRQCPDPPTEVDPDTDDESKTDEHKLPDTSECELLNDDPTTRPWTASDQGACSPPAPFSTLPPPHHHLYACVPFRVPP